MIRKSISFALLLIIPALADAQNRSIDFEHSDFAAVLAKAKKENKLIYIDCYTTWCGPCKWMANNVFTNDTVADFYNKNFVNAKIDMEKGEGIEIAKRYGIQAYPTNLYVNGDGVQVYRMCGSMASKEFVLNGSNALLPANQLSVIEEKFSGGKTSPQNARSYFEVLEQGCQTYADPVEKYFSNQPESELTSRENWIIFLKYVTDFQSKSFDRFQANKSKFSALYTSDSVNMKLEEVLANGMWGALQNKDVKEFERIKNLIKKSDTKKSKEIVLSGDMAFAFQNKDWKNYALYAAEFITNFASENANELNSVAWTFYQQVTETKMLEKAATWAKKATELDANYAYYDTYAAVLYKLGKKSEAKSAAEKSISLAKESGADSKETEELLKKIDALK